MTSAQAARLLAAHGVRPSAQRMAIYAWLAGHPVHPTSDQVHRALVSRYPTLSRTTVHHTLLLLAEVGLANRLVIEEDKLRFDADVRPHAHFRCSACGEVCDLALPEAFGAPTLPEGYVPEETHFYLLGRCPRCAPPGVNEKSPRWGEGEEWSPPRGSNSRPQH